MKDQQIFDLIEQEKSRQDSVLRLIPSENYVSKQVMEASGSCLTNKYSEGYPGKRYYEGQEIIDEIETIAIERAKKLFGADHVNVQSHSGSTANLAAYNAVLEPGDKILGMHLFHGGHLTHGWKVSITGKIYNAVHYTVDENTGELNYDHIMDLAQKEKPKLIVCGATAYPREFDFKAFRKIADSVGAYLLADIAHIAGLIVGGVHESPFGIADIITSTSHKTLRGPRGGLIFCKKELAEQIDKSVFPGCIGGPLENIIAAKAVSFAEADTPEFKEYAKQVVNNAKALAEELMNRGYKLITNGTDNHLILIDCIKSKNITGKIAAKALNKAGMVTNMNTIPFDLRKPFDPSGIRIGTPAITTRGMKQEQMPQIANFFDKIFENIENESELLKIRQDISEFVKDFPIPEFFT